MSDTPHDPRPLGTTGNARLSRTFDDAGAPAGDAVPFSAGFPVVGSLIPAYVIEIAGERHALSNSRWDYEPPLPGPDEDDPFIGVAFERGPEGLRVKSVTRYNCRTIDIPPIVCSQAQLARGLGHDEHYTRLVEVLKRQGTILRYEKISRCKFRVWLRNADDRRRVEEADRRRKRRT
jgi:hypothetical protein